MTVEQVKDIYDTTPGISLSEVNFDSRFARLGFDVAETVPVPHLQSVVSVKYVAYNISKDDKTFDISVIRSANDFEAERDIPTENELRGFLDSHSKELVFSHLEFWADECQFEDD